MIKYLSLIALSLGLLACQSEQDQTMTEQAPQDNLKGQFEQQTPPEIEVSDDELETFVEISGVAQQVQMEAQSEMVSVVEDEDLSVETYNVIAESRYNDQPDVTREELDKFEAASERIGEMERELDQAVAQAVEQEGMSMDRFMQINMALQQDSSLQQRIQQMMMDSQMQQQQQANPE